VLMCKKATVFRTHTLHHFVQTPFG